MKCFSSCSEVFEQLSVSGAMPRCIMFVGLTDNQLIAHIKKKKKIQIHYLRCCLAWLNYFEMLWCSKGCNVGIHFVLLT